MLTADGQCEDGPVLFLGLTKADLADMCCDGPIEIDGRAMAEAGLPPLGLIIAYGRTEGDLADLIRSYGVAFDQSGPPR